MQCYWWLYKRFRGEARVNYCTRNKWEKKHVLTLTLMLVRSACKTSTGSSTIFWWLVPLLGPNLDHKTGPKQRPKRRNENVIRHRRISLLPANILQADLRPGKLEHECQHIPFSLCASQGRLLLSRSLYRSHVLSTFFRSFFEGHEGLLAFEALRPTPCCESLRQLHPNNSKQHGALAKIGNMLFFFLWCGR